jgi:hypothetical protein
MARSTNEERPLWWAGTGANADEAREPVVLQPPGKDTRIALFAVASGSYQGRVASLYDPSLAERLAAARERADLVLISVHHGPEYVHVPYKETVNRYHALIDAGADLVIAHHPHVVQGVERYKKGFIFYSLGNFSFGSKTRRHLAKGARLYSLIGRVTLEKGVLARVELIPLYANNGYRWTLGEHTLEPRHATPQLLAKDFAQAALDELEAFSRDIPGADETRIQRVGDRGFVDLGMPEMADEERAESLHQQAHEYAAVVALDASPRAATAGEKQVTGRGGTPDSAVRAAQEQAKKQSTRARGGSKGKKTGKTRSRKGGPKGGKASKGAGKKAVRGKSGKRGAGKR